MIAGKIANGKLELSMSYQDYQEIASELKQHFFYRPSDKAWISREEVGESFLEISFLTTDIKNTIQKYSEVSLDALKDISSTIKTKYPYLRPYQTDAVITSLQSKKGQGIFYDVGLGKTLITLIVVKEILQSAIVVTNVSLLNQWKEEALQWKLFKEDEIAILSSSVKKQDRELLIKEQKPLLIMNYAMYKKYIKDIVGADYKIACFDEASKLKNEKTKLYEATSHARNYFEKIFMLTATPYENKLTDIFNISKLIDPSFMTRSAFNYGHCVWDKIDVPDPRNRGARREISVISGYKNVTPFVEKLKRFSVFKDKSEIADQLPDITYINRGITSTKMQRLIAAKIKYYALSNRGSIFSAFTLLRVIDNGLYELKQSSAEMIDDAVDISFDNAKISDAPKVGQLVDELLEIGDRQVLIFTGFAKTALALKEFLSDKKIDCEVVTGGTSVADKQTLVSDFKDNKIRIMIATDCLSQGANFPDIDFIINYDLHPNPSTMKQRNGRIHRLSSKNAKVVINFIGDIVERRVLEIVETKTENFNEMALSYKILPDLYIPE